MECFVSPFCILAQTGVKPEYLLKVYASDDVAEALRRQSNTYVSLLLVTGGIIITLRLLNNGTSQLATFTGYIYNMLKL